MKKITMLMLGVLVSTLTFAGRRDDAPKSAAGIAVVKRDVNAYKLIYKSAEKSDVNVQIFNEKDVLIFSEVIRNSDGFIRPYNLEALGEGEYTIKVNNGSNYMAETIALRETDALKGSQLIKTHEGKYLLTVAAHGADYLTVNIWNSKGEKLHSDFSTVNGDFARVYNLDKVSGPFSFELTDTTGHSKTFKK